MYLDVLLGFDYTFFSPHIVWTTVSVFLAMYAWKFDIRFCCMQGIVGFGIGLAAMVCLRVLLLH